MPSIVKACFQKHSIEVNQLCHKIKYISLAHVILNSQQLLCCRKVKHESGDIHDDGQDRTLYHMDKFEK